MEPGVAEKLHLISLVIRKNRDVPGVRAKAKLLAGRMGFQRLDVIRVALAASEVARFLLLYTGGGVIKISLIKMDREELGVGIEFFFEGRKAPRAWMQRSPNGPESSGIPHMHPWPGLRKVLDLVQIDEFLPGSPVRIRALKWGLNLSWEELQAREPSIRDDLFADTEESYLENLRAKHEEVLVLLRERSEKNRELDRANNELLELGRDLEALAHERTTAELALKVADQIRNPVTTIGGLANLMARELPKDIPGRNKLEAILKEARRLEEIVRDFEQLAVEQMRFFQKEDLRSLTREGVSSWSQRAVHKGLKTELHSCESPLPVWINPRTFKVALVHLLRNAEDASPPGGTIKIEVNRMEGRPFVSVSDQGAGIPENVLNRLFKASVTTKARGAGVGLLLVKQIMEEHQGEIRIETTPGEGSTVSLVFPERWKEDSRCFKSFVGNIVCNSHSQESR